ncbi:Uncharacterised protein [Nocardia otitidiscaviarum]|uniref:Uncharacterized protein n=1 Tax=Nocardia otitidiscaviarum TaxID=1823 RepID=A0A378Y736_9NOCA|nr:DUF5691 domain-containing protein [Nocardia otitidiscaviarum]SUA73022.1 Uncharacterised protein [Nocardia otitidiscaviarum]
MPTRETAAVPGDPSAVAGRRSAAGKRHARVSAGLADLDIWLADQVRTGLAQMDRSHQVFEAVAARMVDAQAPGVARALRELARVGTWADWPQRLLREFGRLHLLIAAHQRLDHLSPALRASVRTHIGYPTPVDSVREQPAVRDIWQVLATRTTVEDGLYSRRTWLRGTTTARWALLHDHHYGSPTFPQDTPAPGVHIDADLHYYPAAAPLRAIWGERYGEPASHTERPNADISSASPPPGPLPAPEPGTTTAVEHRDPNTTPDFTSTTAPPPDPAATAHSATTAAAPDVTATAPSATTVTGLGNSGAPSSATTNAGAETPTAAPTATESDSATAPGASTTTALDNGDPPSSAATTTEPETPATPDVHPATGLDSDSAPSSATTAPGLATSATPPAAASATTGRGSVTGPPDSIDAAGLGIFAALGAHAAAVGADPFLRSWPMMLVDVVPVRSESGWYVVEATGDSLPVTVEDGEPWRMLGVSGGHPVTVVGEWTTDGLVPLAVHAAGTVVDAVAADGISVATPPVTSALGGRPGTAADAEPGIAELVSTALVGTARRTVDTAALPAPVAAASRSGADPAVALLEAIALQDCFVRGAVSPSAAEKSDTAEDDPRPLLPPVAAARLASLLTGTSSFLAEWFAAAEPFDYRAPDAMCSRLLERAKSVAVHREALLRLAGARGRWLAARHPGWRGLIRAAADDDSVWSHGRPAERRAWLARLRRTDPGAARTALAASWPTESGPGKVELLAVLADGLSTADAPLLESGLDDRRAEVRRLAADLLARLPDSAFAGRMARRASAWLTMGAHPDGPRLTTTGPGVLDDAARRDGIADPFPFTAYRADGAPDLAAEWLHRVVAATPLRHWEPLGPPEEAVRVPMAEGLRGPMLHGWADAALAQRDPAWARALFAIIAAAAAGDPDMEQLRELFAMQPLDDQVRHLRRLDSSWLAEIESLLRALPHPWPEPVAEHVLRLLLERARLSANRPGAPSLVPGSYRTLFRAAATHFPVTTAPAVTTTARHCGEPYWEQAFDQLAADLVERRTMLEELQ